MASSPTHGTPATTAKPCCLWSVPDEPTRALMVDFYQRILNGEPCADALHAAQNDLRLKYPDPYFWRAFICLGDPGPLLRSTRRP